METDASKKHANEAEISKKIEALVVSPLGKTPYDTEKKGEVKGLLLKGSSEFLGYMKHGKVQIKFGETPIEKYQVVLVNYVLGKEMSFIYESDGAKFDTLSAELKAMTESKTDLPKLAGVILTNVKSKCADATKSEDKGIHTIVSPNCDLLNDTAHKVDMALIREFGNSFFWYQIQSAYFDAEDIIPINAEAEKMVTNSITNYMNTYDEITKSTSSTQTTLKIEDLKTFIAD